LKVERKGKEKGFNAEFAEKRDGNTEGAEGRTQRAQRKEREKKEKRKRKVNAEAQRALRFA